MADTKKVKVNDVLSIEKCEKRGYFESLGFGYSKGKSYQIAIALKEFLGELLFDKFDEVEALKFFKEKVDLSLFPSQDSKNDELSILVKQLKRYIAFESLKNRKVLLKNYSTELKIGEVNITVSADFIFDNGENIEVVKFKRSEPSLSYRGQKFETKPQYSMELYLLSELGKSIYPDREILASLYHLKSKDDTSKEMITYFEVKKGKNIISHNFNEEDSKFMEERLATLVNTKLSINGKETCNESLCESCSFKNVCKYERPQNKLELEVVEKVKKAGELKLTMPQHDAIMFEEGIARINAGAGSGKTTVVALRVVELIKNGCKPSDILLVTFTNKGAQEMRDKISYWLSKFKVKNVEVSKMHIMTFNSWGEMVIKRKYQLLGFTNEPQLADKVQRYDIIFKLLNEFDRLEGSDYKNPLIDFPNAKGVVVEVDEYFDCIKANYISTAQGVCDKLKLTPSKAEAVFKMYNRFNELLLENNLLQYQDQINYLIQLMDEYPEELEEFAYKHIIIDEYQDTDKIQFDIIAFLTGLSKFKSLMVVGDDSQSIFSFRNTSAENILKFHEYFEDVKDVFLVDNFRSTPEIIATANALNDLNINKIDKKLISRQASNGIRPKLWKHSTPDEEYLNIAKIAKSCIEDGVNPENIAVIARTKSELYKIESYLKNEGIPYIMDIAEPLLNNSNLHILVSFADFFENEYLDYGLFEYLYVFKEEEIKNMSNEEIIALVNKYKGSFLPKLQALETEEEKLNFFFDIVKSIAKNDITMEAFLTELKEKNFPSLNDLLDYLRKIVAYKDEKSVNRDDLTYRAVVLTTAHTSKGKEFDVVINTIDRYKYERGMSLEEIEEERRLLFVSITRAKKELYITYHTNQDRVKIKNTYCNFVNELKFVDHCEGVITTSKVS